MAFRLVSQPRLDPLGVAVDVAAAFIDAHRAVRDPQPQTTGADGIQPVKQKSPPAEPTRLLTPAEREPAEHGHQLLDLWRRQRPSRVGTPAEDVELHAD